MIDKYNVDNDVIVFAYKYAKKNTKSVKSVKYIEGIIRSWMDMGLYNVEDIEISIVNDKRRFEFYRLIFNTIGFLRCPSSYEKILMDTWIDKYEMDIDVIIYACEKCKYVSSPSLSYLNAIIENYNKNNVKTVNDIKNM